MVKFKFFLKENLKLDSNSDSDITDDENELHEDELAPESPKFTIETSIGPPKILQYKPEVKNPEPEISSPTFSIPNDSIESVNQFMKGFNVYIKGGERCEFCDYTTKPWPSIADQEITSPEEVYFFQLYLFDN